MLLDHAVRFCCFIVQRVFILLGLRWMSRKKEEKCSGVGGSRWGRRGHKKKKNKKEEQSIEVK